MISKNICSTFLRSKKTQVGGARIFFGIFGGRFLGMVVWFSTGGYTPSSTFGCSFPLFFITDVGGGGSIITIRTVITVKNCQELLWTVLDCLYSVEYQDYQNYQNYYGLFWIVFQQVFITPKTNIFHIVIFFIFCYTNIKKGVYPYVCVWVRVGVCLPLVKKSSKTMENALLGEWGMESHFRCVKKVRFCVS